jgi:hypothetical protein
VGFAEVKPVLGEVHRGYFCLFYFGKLQASKADRTGTNYQNFVIFSGFGPFDGVEADAQYLNQRKLFIAEFVGLMKVFGRQSDEFGLLGDSVSSCKPIK